MNPKKRILIVSRSFYPDNSPRAFRTAELSKEFARQGHYSDYAQSKRASRIWAKEWDSN